MWSCATTDAGHAQRSFLTVARLSVALQLFYCRPLDMKFHFYEDTYDMFHVCTTFYQMISLDDTILLREYDIFHV